MVLSKHTWQLQIMAWKKEKIRLVSCEVDISHCDTLFGTSFGHHDKSTSQISCRIRCQPEGYGGIAPLIEICILFSQAEGCDEGALSNKYFPSRRTIAYHCLITLEAFLVNMVKIWKIRADLRDFEWIRASGCTGTLVELPMQCPWC